MPKKAIAAAMSAVIMLLSLSGCVYSAEELISPPRLNDTQNAIYSALTSAAGQNIRLKYPASGENRSACTIADIDGDGEDEAVAFYEITSGAGAGALRINVMEQQDGEWRSVLDYAAVGSDVDTLMVSEFGEQRENVLFVGYLNSGTGDKTLIGYVYCGNSLDILISGSYSAFDVYDLTGDGNNDIICFSANGETAFCEIWEGLIVDFDLDLYTSPAVEYTALYARQEDGVFLRDVVEVENSAEIACITRGNVGRSTPALFVDVERDGTVSTQIIYYRLYVLVNSKSARSVTRKTSRPAGYYCTDIDRDGVIEIPVLSPFPGYDSGESDAEYVTEWYVFENNNILKKYSSYYNPEYGYCFMLPNTWTGSVTVRYDDQADEAVICYYDPESERHMSEIMRICVVRKGSNKPEGYITAGSQGQLEYLFRLSDEAAAGEYLSIGETEILLGFIIL